MWEFVERMTNATGSVSPLARHINKVVLHFYGGEDILYRVYSRAVTDFWRRERGINIWEDHSADSFPRGWNMGRGMWSSVTMMAEQFGNVISFLLARSALEIFLWIASYRIILRNKVSNVTFSYYVSIESAALIGRATSVSRAGAWHVAIINNVVRSWQSRLMEGRFPRNRKFRDDGVQKKEREREGGEKKECNTFERRKVHSCFIRPW